MYSSYSSHERRVTGLTFWQHNSTGMYILNKHIACIWCFLLLSVFSSAARALLPTLERRMALPCRRIKPAGALIQGSSANTAAAVAATTAAILFASKSHDVFSETKERNSPISDDVVAPETTRGGNDQDKMLEVELAVVETFLEDFQSAWNCQSGTRVVEDFFVEPTKTATETATMTPFWRDMVAFTWDIQTMEGPTAIVQALEDDGVSRAREKCRRFQLSNKPLPLKYNDDGTLEFWCDFTLDSIGSGKAHFRLVRLKDPSGTKESGAKFFKIHTLLTTLLELSDRPFQIGDNRIRGHKAGAIRNRKYWPERLLSQREDKKDDPFVVIVGGGQAGLALGARLHLMDIPYTILEAGPKPGSAWRKRYPSLHLHDPVWYNHMPYLPFPETWPIFCPRDKIAEWMETYAKTLDLNVQTNSRVLKVQESSSSSSSNGKGGSTWEVQVQQAEGENGKKATTRTRTISSKHVVFATGNSSKPRVPKNIPGQFMGLQLHSSQYRGGRPHAGKRVVVVGSNNSGWDIVQDLWEQGAAKVTMIQRSPSMVVSTQSVLTHGLGALYRQDAPLHHEDADLVATCVPYKLLIPKWKAINRQMQSTDHELLSNLAVAGYQLDDGPDGAGIFAKSATEGGGFYIDMGCADLVIRKEVSVRYATVSCLDEDGIVIRDKTTEKEERLPADVIVYATGFETMDQWLSQLCNEEIATKVGKTWGLGLGKGPKDPGPWEGELRNMWKPTSVDGLWFHGGNLAQSRHYSRFLALQLGARYIGIETPVFGVTPQ